MTTHLEILKKHVSLDGKNVTDIGAGNGDFAASLAALGAAVTAIEIDQNRVSAIHAKHGNILSAHVGTAENLPLETNSQDVLCFIFSFHHIPLDMQDDALAETSRVLRPGGQLFIAEPLPFGPMTEIVKPLDDETRVRTVSQNRLDDLSENSGFRLVVKEHYTIHRIFNDFDELAVKLIENDRNRATEFPSAAPEMKRRFLENSETKGNGYSLAQPCVCFQFEVV